MWLSTPQPTPYHCLLDHQHHEARKNIAALSFCRSASWIYSFVQIIMRRWFAFTNGGHGGLDGCADRNLAFFAQTQVFGLRGLMSGSRCWNPNNALLLLLLFTFYDCTRGRFCRGGTTFTP